MSDLPSRRFQPGRIVLWLILLVVSVAVGCVLWRANVPAAFFVASVGCGLAFSLCGASLGLARPLFLGAQSLIGCAVAKGMTAGILATLLGNWMVMLLMVASTVLAGGLVGWGLTKGRVLPGTTAAWGTSPGGASAMVALADAYGADARLVALMQYLRVLLVVLCASVVGHYLALPPADSVATNSWQRLLEGGPILSIVATLAIAAISVLVTQQLRIPAGAVLLPMLIGAGLNAYGVLNFSLPYGFQVGASICLGWYVGLGFTRAMLFSALRMLHRLLLSAVLLIVLCAAFAWLLYRFVGCDPLTAFLATSPGGIDTVILIAMGSQADVPFVVAAQTLRLFVVILAGPAIARFICRMA